MGAINYGSNNIINLGYKTNDDIEDDSDYQQYLFNDICDLIDNNYTYYSVSIHSGYYDGFYIDIKHEYSILDTYQDRRAMVQEWSTIQSMLVDIIKDYNMNVYGSCGWCGCSWLDYKDSLQAIKQVGKIERHTIKHNYRLYSNFNNYQSMVDYLNSCTL